MNDRQRFERVAEMFEAARDKNGADRDVFLDEACADRPDVLLEVRKLLAHHDDRGLLDVPVFPAGAASNAHRAAAPSQLPSQIGPYRVKRELGVGGMGIVCLAEQDKPRREVAIKLIRPGLVTRELLKRFDRETALLGRLQHPGIAQIYEAGTYDDGSGGRPYFAMEFVDGAPLMAYACDRNLGLRDRLETFARICEAVEHAHQRGIIHRDLKPGNILVDKSGQPKILDFGVACATESDLQMSTLQTDAGQLIGTVAYMSPEQVCGRSGDIDTRSDVYALGVILYELIADRLPYDLDDRTIAAVARVITEQDPTSLGTVNRGYRGDLHTIVHKALEKDPDRRYQSASALAADVRHFLSDEPIVARPATTMYQLRKFARRNKALVAGLVIAFLAISGGAVSATIGMMHARDEASRALAMSEFLESVLVAADSTRSGDVRLVELLRDAGSRVDTEFAAHPEVALRVHQLLAQAFYNIAYHDESETHARRWLELVESIRGSGHPDSRRSRVVLAKSLGARMHLEEAEDLLRGVLDESGEGAQDVVTLDARIALGYVLTSRRMYEEAERTLRRSLRQVEDTYGPSHLLALRALSSLARAIDNRALHGDEDSATRASLRAEAADLNRQVIDRERQSGARTRDALTARLSLSDYLRALGRYDEAAKHARKGMELSEAWLGADHTTMADFRRRLARALFGAGDYEEAATQVMRSVAWSRDIQRDKLRTAVTMVMALPIVDAAGEWEIAMEYAQYLVDQFGADAHGGIGIEARAWLPYLHTRLGEPEKAPALFEELFRLEETMDDQNRARLHYARGTWCIAQNEPGEARSHLEQALELCDDDLYTWPNRPPIRAAIDGLSR